MGNSINILGISGSLRKGSYNRMLLQSAIELASKDMAIEVFNLDEIPLFNADLEQILPVKVKQLKSKIRAANAILIVTPEYNYSVPGVLKNAIDWGSRPQGDNSWEGKPIAIMSASIGLLGGARAQYHLRQTLVCLDMHPINKPEVMINFATQTFDDKGNLIDDKAKELIRMLLTNLAAWTKKLQPIT